MTRDPQTELSPQDAAAVREARAKARRADLREAFLRSMRSRLEPAGQPGKVEQALRGLNYIRLRFGAHSHQYEVAIEQLQLAGQL